MNVSQEASIEHPRSTHTVSWKDINLGCELLALNVIIHPSLSYSFEGWACQSVWFFLGVKICCLIKVCWHLKELLMVIAYSHDNVGQG